MVTEANVPTIVVLQSGSLVPILNTGVQTVIVNQLAQGGNLLVVDPTTNYVVLGTQGPAGAASEEGAAVFVQGRATESEVILRYVWIGAVNLSTQSRATAGIAPTADSVFTLYRDPGRVSIGTLTFSAASVDGVFAISNPAFAAGQTLVIVAPATVDATLADVAINVIGA